MRTAPWSTGDSKPRSSAKAGPEPDLQIASIALLAGLMLVTGNVRRFAGMPRLRVEN